jgi:purine-binding chemotaxis protein CheW
VDTVRQVVELSPTDVEPPPPFGTRVRVEYLLGMGHVGDAFAVLLDIQRVLSAEELVAATGLANQGPAGAPGGPGAPGEGAAPSEL